ncbi:hypothetical protein NLJ89_g8814 [Agrocybe chaxingu]|uniref:Uncharacterized protein n=1 Tax=Agrocybe chaxingu TaxID=84603 RepID=A0A9W8MTR0_9AGAR|nr:hypothetical protein NLJ89_g8814 [Agrocybe chaxingu]
MPSASTETESRDANEPWPSEAEDRRLLANQPPSVFITNVGRTRVRQINDGPWDDTPIVQSLINALKCIQAKRYRLQSAIYTVQAVYIFIETEDEDWNVYINIHDEL